MERNCARCGNSYVEEHDVWPIYPMCQTCEVKVYGSVSAQHMETTAPVSKPEPFDPVGDCAPSAIF